MLKLTSNALRSISRSTAGRSALMQTTSSAAGLAIGKLEGKAKKTTLAGGCAAVGVAAHVLGVAAPAADGLLGSAGTIFGALVGGKMASKEQAAMLPTAAPKKK